MYLTLIGLPGTGKTYWSKKLEAIGFKRYSVDEIVAQKAGGKTGTTCDAIEKQVMHDLLETLREDDHENVVIDMSSNGSALNKDVIRQFKQFSTVICLGSASTFIQHMYTLFLKKAEESELISLSEIFMDKYIVGNPKKEAIDFLQQIHLYMHG